MNDQGDVATALSDSSYLRGINCAEPSLQLWRIPATETHDDSSLPLHSTTRTVRGIRRMTDHLSSSVTQLACGQGASAEQLAAATVSEVKA